MDDVHILKTIYNNRIFSQFFIADEKTMLVDTGMHGWVERYIRPQLEALDRKLDRLNYIVSTHADVDHYGGNAEVRTAAPDAVLIAHRLDAPWIENADAIMSERFGLYDAYGQGYDAGTKEWLRGAAGPNTPIDVRVCGGETIRLGPNREIALLHSPGHSPGLLTVWDARTRTLIANDAVLGAGMRNKDGVLEGPPPYFMLPEYTNSLSGMLALGFERLLHSHLPEMDREQGLAYIRESIEHVHEVHAYIGQHALQPRPQSMREICERVIGKFGPYSVMPNEIIASVSAHLKQLVHSGKAHVDTSAYPFRWYRKA